jgi:hypothetical protein
MVADNRRDNGRDEEERETNSAGQSGDIQGILRPAEADSESVEELVEEGNAFEASTPKIRMSQRSRPAKSRRTTVPEEYRNDNDRVA